ncbi:MAG: cardiolipin synthase [Burkholderiales bacterium]
MSRHSRKKRNWPLIVGSVAASAVALVVFANLTLGDKPIDTSVPTLYSAEDEQFVQTMGSMLGSPIVPGNSVDVFLNGDQIFPPMLEALRAARRTITFEMYIYWSGNIGKVFADALSERARAGVKVHVLIDGVGSGKIEEAYVEQMLAAGVEVRRYNPPRFYTLNRVNNRTHRKLVVVDGAIGFTGGVGIADQWSGHAQDPEHWRDTHFRVQGPAVAQMQAAFMDNWAEVTGHVLHGEAYFPRLERKGNKLAQVFWSSPQSGSQSMHLMYLLSIAAARKSIVLSMSYFVPDEVVTQMLVAALKRGVAVRIIVPGPHIDTAIVRRASRARWGRLLQAGAEIFEYQPTMFHCKVMVVDGIWTSVGSTNFDNRSFALNDEANLNVYDREFALGQVRIFEEDVKRSRRVTFEEWRNRPWTEKLIERAATLLGTQL